MLARIRKAMNGREEGFTLIELLVVMIIIGILAAIAIPVFLNQRSKARDTSTQADLSTVGKETATYFVDGTGTIALDYTTAPGSVILTAAGGYTAIVKLCSGTISADSGSPAAGGSARLNNSGAGWCVAMTNSAGGAKPYSYSAANGLRQGVCS